MEVKKIIRMRQVESMHFEKTEAFQDRKIMRERQTTNHKQQDNKKRIDGDDPSNTDNGGK